MMINMMETMEIANHHTRHGEYELACICYEKIFKQLSGISINKLITNSTNASHATNTNLLLVLTIEDIQAIDLLFRCYLNHGYCHWKLRNYSIAVDDFTMIIDKYHYEYNPYLDHIPMETENTDVFKTKNEALLGFQRQLISYYQKALLRRIDCYEYMIEYTKAYSDLTLLFTLNPSYAHKPEMIKLQTHLQVSIRQDEVIAKQEGTLQWMHNTSQSLRLFFLRELPSIVLINEGFFM